MAAALRGHVVWTSMPTQSGGHGTHQVSLEDPVGDRLTVFWRAGGRPKRSEATSLIALLRFGNAAQRRKKPKRSEATSPVASLRFGLRTPVHLFEVDGQLQITMAATGLLRHQ